MTQQPAQPSVSQYPGDVQNIASADDAGVNQGPAVVQKTAGSNLLAGKSSLTTRLSPQATALIQAGLTNPSFMQNSKQRNTDSSSDSSDSVNLQQSGGQSLASLPQVTGVSTTEKLNILEKVLDEVEVNAAQTQTDQVSQAQIVQQTQTAQQIQPAESTQYTQPMQSTQPAQSIQPTAPTNAVSGRKEAPESGLSSTLEQPISIQYVEEEKGPELPIEVEKYIQEVQQDKDKAPKEIVIAEAVDDMADDDQYVAERVVVLPITPEIEKQGKNKSPKFSIRWLVEWSKKIIKIFEGKVIYRPAQETNN